jgi:hypothetical protein
MIEVIGWIGTAAVLTSFLMKDMMNLRLMNLAACMIWVGYGIIKQDYPVIVTNAAISVIHIVWLYKNLFTKKEYNNHE